MFNSSSEAARTPARTERLIDEEIYEVDDSINDTMEELKTTKYKTSTSTTNSLFDDFEPFSNVNTGMMMVVAISSFLIAGLIFVFLIQKKTAPKGRFMRWLREFLNFRSIMIAGIIKFLYVFLAVALTITSVIVMFQGRGDTVLTMVLTGLAILIIGNIILRITMEMTMAIISMWDNTSDIREVLVKDEEKSIEKPPKNPETKKELEVERPTKEQPITTSNPVAEQSMETQHEEEKRQITV